MGALTKELPEPIKWIVGTPEKVIGETFGYPPFVKIRSFMVELQRSLGQQLVIGLDPGYAGMGLALGFHKTVRVYQLDWAKEEDSGFAQRVVYIRDLVRVLVLQEGLKMAYLGVGVTTNGDGQTRLDSYRAVVENSAMMPMAESKLAAGRAAAIIGLNDTGLRVEVAAPMTVNKQVFGHGRHKAKELWKQLLPKDAADAVALAILAAKKEWNP